MNAKNLKKQYANECNSFRAALRFVIERAKETEKKIVECGKDASTTEKNEVKKAKAWNDSIIECKKICTILGLSAESLKRKNLDAAREHIVGMYPAKAGEVCVTFAPMPKYVREYKKSYTHLTIVTPASWLDVIIGSSENPSGIVKSDYIITTAPVVHDGVVEKKSSGTILCDKEDIYNAEEIQDICKDWDYLATIKYSANKEGRKASETYYTENVK